MEMIQHFSHEHPLILNEDCRGFTCYGCHKIISGSGYYCKKCHSFILHKSCAELPRELQHPLHQEHQLILLREPPYYPKQFKCNAYEKTYIYEYQALFVYHCSLCKFYLDIKCAFTILPLTMKADSHDHPFTLFPKSIFFTCDACGEEERGMPYLCAKCGIWFHPKCASSHSPRTIKMEAKSHDHPLTLFTKSISFTCDACGKKDTAMPYLCVKCVILIHSKCASSPRTVKNIFHEHLLKLTYSLQNNQFDQPCCQICVENVDLNYWVYHCSICNFIAHLNCATDQKLRDEDLELDEPVEIKHFSHEHDLTLIDNLDINNKKCDGCIRPIFPPFYSCDQCSLVLHKSCVELPIKKRHPLHQHPLTLLPKVPYFGGSSFRCDGCNSRCNGFVYHCSDDHKCTFNLDVKCSSISNKLTHDGHKHPLILSNATNNLNCSACGGSKGNMYRCGKCEFTLNFSCATLPCTIWYRQHQHPFTLQFTAEDDSGEYYCDICEEPRDPKHWFYYCAECSYPAHPKCILGRYPNIKFEKTYTFNFHLHPLTLVKEIKDKAPCQKCWGDCDDLDFECTQCNFKVHKQVSCLGEMMTNG